MAKLTRKSYKRKKIAFAAVILGGVALVSSGFAAWVLSSNAEKDVQGGVKVGTVEKGSLKMEISLEGAETGETGLNSGKFNFNTKADDHTGRVRAAENQKPEDSENLSLSYVVTVKSPIDNFKQLDITMTANKEGKPFDLSSATDETGKITYKFSWTATYIVAFKWGNLFGGKNPGEYYDLEETKSTITGTEVENTLNAMHEALDGISYNLNFLASVN